MRLLVAVLRDGESICLLRQREHDTDDAVAMGQDIAPGLVARPAGRPSRTEPAAPDGAARGRRHGGAGRQRVALLAAMASTAERASANVRDLDDLSPSGTCPTTSLQLSAGARK